MDSLKNCSNAEGDADVLVNEDEKKYLNQISYILKNGEKIIDRTGVGTISVFGMHSIYSLRNGVVPVLTTKRVFWKGVVEELLWFIRGDTNAKHLSEKGVKIWDANGSRQFLDQCGFTDRSEGDLGPVYGFQWRHCGAEYRGMDADYTNQGIDQLSEIINLIKNEPNSRRIILNAWNVRDLKQMALPPCHTLAQFAVRNGELSCQLYQRSGDMGLGVPFNLASYGLLTHMIAHICDLKAGYLCHVLGDAHVYVNHIDALQEQLKRQPQPFPTVRFVGNIKTIDDFTYESIILENYQPMPTIKMTMAIGRIGLFCKMSAVVKVYDEDPTEITFIYDWPVQIFQPVNGFNVFGDTETFCTNYRSANHEWIHLYLEQSTVVTMHPSPKECKFSFRLLGDDTYHGSVIAVHSMTTFASVDSFRVPRDSQFVESLTQCFTNQSNSGI
ncbi:unnamed protein product [Acanthocheilonema viteae]|uniref:Thymidylate synthase n=1 Tax=Acanthocheilonema viteae TaxID=6277 RepID=A0A498SXJ6_ACAVI|nr:unnamed protein product [Acanthocheilonema viteae]